MPLCLDGYVPATPPPTSPSLAPHPWDRDVLGVMADDGDKGPDHYPPTELEWLATTAFNHAVDYYVQENDGLCKAWAERALKLAEWAEDGCGLAGALMEKYTGLTWGDE